MRCAVELEPLFKNFRLYAQTGEQLSTIERDRFLQALLTAFGGEFREGVYVDRDSFGVELQPLFFRDQDRRILISERFAQRQDDLPKALTGLLLKPVTPQKRR